MKTRTIFLSTAIPAAAFGLFAQESRVVITGGARGGDGPVTIAQTGGGFIGISGEPGNVRFMSQEFSFNGRPVANAPYSADEKTESVQTLADGNRITNTTTAHVYRDSQGRTRREMTLPGFGGDQPHTITTINDPITGVNYTFDSENKVAHQIPGAAEAKMMAEMDAKVRARIESHGVEPRAAVIRTAPAPVVQHEDLGENVMEGVSAKGTARDQHHRRRGHG